MSKVYGVHGVIGTVSYKSSPVTAPPKPKKTRAELLEQIRDLKYELEVEKEDLAQVKEERARLRELVDFLVNQLGGEL